MSWQKAVAALTAERGRALTDGRQHPDVEFRGQDIRLLAASL